MAKTRPAGPKKPKTPPGLSVCHILEGGKIRRCKRCGYPLAAQLEFTWRYGKKVVGSPELPLEVNILWLPCLCKFGQPPKVRPRKKT